MRPVALAAILTALIVPAVAPVALAQTGARNFIVSEDHHTVAEASFTSRAAIVRMRGATKDVSGSANIALDDLAHASGTVNVNLQTVDTGISMRNTHMKGFLEADKYPQAIFKFSSIKIAGNHLKPGVLAAGTAVGTLTIHGVTKPLNAPIELTYLPQGDPKYRAGDWLHFYSQFKTHISDFDIKLPAPILGPKVSNDLTIEIDGMAKGE